MDLPPIGIGTAHISAEDMVPILRTAVLGANVFHIDCAKVYGNEQHVGKALKSIFETTPIKRENLFITSKVWNDDHLNVEEACRASLRRLVGSCFV